MDWTQWVVGGVSLTMMAAGIALLVFAGTWRPTHRQRIDRWEWEWLASEDGGWGDTIAWETARLVAERLDRNSGASA